MAGTDVEMENADKMEVDVARDRQDLLTSKEIQQEKEHKQQEHMHLEGQKSYKIAADHKSIDIATNDQILGEIDMENSGVHSDILGEKFVTKHTMENQKISGENLIEKEKNLGKSPQECTLLPRGGEADQIDIAQNKVDDTVKNDISETENKRSTNNTNDKLDSDHTRLPADQVEPVTPIANETFKVQGGDTNNIKVMYYYLCQEVMKYSQC